MATECADSAAAGVSDPPGSGPSAEASAQPLEFHQQDDLSDNDSYKLGFELEAEQQKVPSGNEN